MTTECRPSRRRGRAAVGHATAPAGRRKLRVSATILLLPGVLACSESGAGRRSDIDFDTIRGPRTVELIAARATAPDVRRDARLELGAALRSLERPDDALLTLDAVERHLLEHERCALRVAAWELLGDAGYGLENGRVDVDDDTRGRILSALGSGALAAGRVAVNPATCSHDPPVETASCYVDYAQEEDVLSDMATPVSTICLQLEAAEFVRNAMRRLDDPELAASLVELARTAEDRVVRGRVLSLLDRIVRPRGAKLIDDAALRLTADPDPAVRARAERLLAREAFRVSVARAVPLVFGGSVDGRVEADGSAPIYALTLTGTSRVALDLTSPADLDPVLIVTDDEGNVVGRDDDGGSGGAARLVVTLRAGTYYVLPTGFPGSTGAFRLTTR